MLPNLPVLFAAGLIPFAIAFVYFHPRLFGGRHWANVANLSTDQANKSVSPVKLLLSILLNVFLAFSLYIFSVHPSGVFGMVGGDTTQLVDGTAKAFLDEYALNYLNFGHGVIHGAIFGSLFMALPFYGYVAIFEHKSWKYVLTNYVFWVISMAVVGGVVCAYGWKWAA